MSRRCSRRLEALGTDRPDEAYDGLRMKEGMPIPPMRVEPLVLEGRLVRLEPLGEDHLPDLALAAADPETWRWMPERSTTLQDLRGWLDRALALAGTSQLPFATIERATGRAVGSTRYIAIERAHLRLEIGWTWLAPEARGRGLNDEAKLLLLRHAFTELGARRIEFKTDSRNARSRGALEGIGATFEGIFRKHMLNHGWDSRDSAWYSILDDDWPAVERHLEARVARHLPREGASEEMALKGGQPTSTIR